MGTFSKKVVSASLAVLTTVSMFGGSALVPVASAQTSASIAAQIALLQAQLAALGGATTCVAPSQPLTVGSNNAQVKALQMWLNSRGFAVSASGAGSMGMESTYFGALTRAALARFQVSAGITPAVGYYGPITMAAIQARCTVTSPTPTPTPSNPSGPLQGGAGSVEDYSLVSGLSGEEVGEDEADVEVAGLEMEIDDGSDLEFTAVRLVFDEGSGATSDFEDYADEVSVWLDGEEVARVDADDFNDDNDWTKTVSLDGAIARSGDTVELTVGISGASNLDTNDGGDSWDVDFRQVRFVDADGATVSEDPTQSEVTFSFESFATAANTEFQITQGAKEDEVNDAHLIDIHATEETQNVEILSFNVEIEGDSDVIVDAMPVKITVATQDHIEEMISDLSLWMDGVEVGSASISSDCLDDADCADVGTQETYLFDDMDLTLEAGEEYEFIVAVDIYGDTDTPGDVAPGDTIYGEFGEGMTDNANFDAEDESGENLADADTTGSVVGSASEVRDVGFNLELVSVSAVKSHAGDVANTNDHDEGTFTIVFDVTAFGGDIFIDETAPDGTGGSTESDLNFTGVYGFLAGSIECEDCTDLTNSKRVDEDETERFTITAVVSAQADGLFDMSLASLSYALTDADSTLEYTFNLDEFETPELFLNYDA